MKKVASLKICVLGGRSFGKTSLLSSLIAISGTKEAGISTLGDNQRKLAIYNDYKDGHGKLSATSWDDICQFRYKITGGGNKRWVVSFIDYPGEFFQKFFEDEYSGILNGVLAKLKISGQSGKPTQEDMSYGGETKKAKRIFKEILSADALIVLLPADSEKPEYKKLLPTFKARLESLLQTIEERNPYIPVCLAINKSDMLENRSVEDLLGRPEFAGFHNMLTRERGRCYFYQPVSAFGGNKATGLSPDTENIEDLRQTWDGKSEPQNVLPMLIKVSEMAEEGRYKLLRERFDKATTAAKTLIWAFSWFRVRGLGANKEEDRKYCVKNLVQCAVRFGAFILISALVAFCAMSTACSLNAWSTLRDYDKKLTSAEQSCKGDAWFILGKNDIKGLSECRPRQLGQLVFFCKKKVDSLKKRYEDLEDDRNLRVFTTVRKECGGQKLSDGGDAMNVTKRLDLFDARIARYQNATNNIFGSETRITADEKRAERGTDNLLVDQKLVQIINEQNTLKQYLVNDKDFFLDLQKVHAAKEQDFCREAERFLEKYKYVKDHLKDKRDNVDVRMKDREKKLSMKADEYLTNHADKPDSEDYENRIILAQARIACVTNLLNQISTQSTCRGKYDDEKQKSEDLIADLNNDKPCYEAMAELREDNRNIVTGKVRRIHAFLQDYAKYSRCEKFMTPFRHEYSNELCRIQSECFHNVTNNYVKDSQPTAEKIKRTQSQIAAYQIAYNEYVIGSDKFLEAEEKIKELKVRLGEYENSNNLEKVFAEDLEKVYKSEEGAFCREAEKFLDKYVYAKDDKRFAVQYKELENAKQERENKANGELQSYLDAHKDDETSEDYQNRIRQANDRIDAIDSFILKIGLKSSFIGQYPSLKSENEILIRNLTSDAPFYEALAELHTQNQKEARGKIRRNDAFLKAHKDYLRCKRFWTSVREDYSNEVRRVQNECRTVVTNNSIDVRGISTGKKIERIDNQIKAYENARDEYVIGSVEFQNAEKSISQLKGMLVDAQKMNGCEMKLHRIEASSYNGRLKALAKFKNENKEILTTEQEKEVERLEADALRHWQDYQSTNELRYAIKEDDALNVQKRKADELETVYSTLMEEMLPNSPHYTQLEQKKRDLGDRKQAIEHDQKLVNAFRALPSTNAVERCQLLNAIDIFESTYYVADYTSKHGKEVFNQLKQVKAEVGRAFLSDHTNRISKVECPPETNFFGRCQWADACMKITEESCKGLNTNNVIRIGLVAEREKYDEQYRRFVKLFNLASLANEIAGKSPTNDVRVVCDRLSVIKKFYASYPPEANQDPLVGVYYSKVKNAQEENEEVVSRYIDGELSKMDGELPYGAPEEKKLEVWEKEIDLLGEYLPKLIEGTNPHTVYKKRLADLNSRFSITQRKDMFDQDYRKLLAEIANEQDLRRKLQKLQEFLGKNQDVRSNDFARDKLSALKNEAERIEKDIEFNKYNDDLDQVVNGRPAEDADGSAFAEFKMQITSLQERLDKFKQSSQLKSKCQSVDQKLQAQLDYVKKALEVGGWIAIQQKEEEYKNNPCEETEEKLRTALDKFDKERFRTFLENKKEVKRRFDKDMELRNKVLSAKVSFFENPNHSKFVEFKKAVETCLAWERGNNQQRGYGCNWPFVDDCFKYISKIENGIPVKLSLVSVGFDDKWDNVKLTIGASQPINIYKGHESAFQPRPVTISYCSELKIVATYEYFAAYRPAEGQIEFWDLIKSGSKDGEGLVEIRFSVLEKYWVGKPHYINGIVTFRVNDIPYMP
jgi:hypothetical protein